MIENILNAIAELAFHSIDDSEKLENFQRVIEQLRKDNLEKNQNKIMLKDYFDPEWEELVG